ncbi:MAG: hypothetical protein V4714_02075 [Bacteroidota bacterium]
MPKLIEYSPINRQGERYYNLALMDLVFDSIEGTYRKDDLAQTNNGDIRKVLYTVVSTIENFFELHPAATVHIAGSDEQRIRVYRMLIRRHWKDIEPIYYVKGFINGLLEDFKENKSYEFSLISKK